MIIFNASQRTNKSQSLHRILFLALVILLSGCTTLTGPSKDNPLPKSELRAELEQMRADLVDKFRPRLEA